MHDLLAYVDDYEVRGDLVAAGGPDICVQQQQILVLGEWIDVEVLSQESQDRIDDALSEAARDAIRDARDMAWQGKERW